MTAKYRPVGHSLKESINNIVSLFYGSMDSVSAFEI